MFARRLQTLWLLPVLDARAAALLAGAQPARSSHHLLFVVLESMKLLALIALPFTLRGRASQRDPSAPNGSERRSA